MMKNNVTQKNISLSKTGYLALTGLFAALITMMTAYVCHIPIGINGGYVHFGDSLIYLAAVLLPRPYALAAAAIGGGMADLLTAPMWAPATVIIKMLLVLPFNNKTAKIVTQHNIFAAVPACFITVFGYFLAEAVLFGSWSVLLVTMFQNLIQSAGSALFFVIIGKMLDEAHIKTRLIHDR